jgi:solute carrier family 25 folate transporter 32
MTHAEFIAGVVAGGATTALCHPLDVVKLMLQVDDGRNRRLTSTISFRNSSLVCNMRQAYQLEGWRFFYRGFASHILASTFSWGAYFAIYSWLKSNFLHVSGARGHDHQTMPTLRFLREHFAISCMAGAATLSFSNPLWVVKTRLCLQTPISTNRYHGIFDALRSIYRVEGIPGLYKGFSVGLFGTMHGGIQFASYELLKTHYSSTDGLKPSVPKVLLISSASKSLAIATMYPYQVLKSRLQNLHGDSTGQLYNGIFDIIFRTFRYEGWRGFYKGLGVNLFRVLPSTWITFITYEFVVHYLNAK